MQCVHIVHHGCYSFCSGAMDNAEYACYCDMFDHMTEASPPLVDLIGQSIVTMVIIGPPMCLCSIFENVARNMLSEINETQSERRKTSDSGE